MSSVLLLVEYRSPILSIPNDSGNIMTTAAASRVYNGIRLVSKRTTRIQWTYFTSRVMSYTSVMASTVTEG